LSKHVGQERKKPGGQNGESSRGRAQPGQRARGRRGLPPHPRGDRVREVGGAVEGHGGLCLCLLSEMEPLGFLGKEKPGVGLPQSLQLLC
jgi:hypothetical protein